MLEAGVEQYRCITAQKALLDAERQINRLQREYEAFLRHELKNRLNPMLGYAELLLKLDNTDLSAKQQEYLEKVIGRVEHMGRLIDSLKKLQEFERGIFNIDQSPCDIMAMIKQSINEQSAIFGNYASIECVYDAAQTIVQGDAHLLPGVFDNLIKNAVEHVAALPSDQQRRVAITLHNEEQWLVVQINNSGPPIAAEHLERFFEKFNTDR
jgi:signal transduction histidine kinase